MKQENIMPGNRQLVNIGEYKIFGLPMPKMPIVATPVPNDTQIEPSKNNKPNAGKSKPIKK